MSGQNGRAFSSRQYPCENALRPLAVFREFEKQELVFVSKFKKENWPSIWGYRSGGGNQRSSLHGAFWLGFPLQIAFGWPAPDSELFDARRSHRRRAA